ncbi:MAG: extracellular solute-binding protein [Oscillibacter sp.]|nr:extracellular solute-binding protein [Oscillibacter sp.]
MKKFFALLLALLMCLSVLAGCGKTQTTTSGSTGSEPSGTLNVYTTVSDLQYNAIMGAFQKKYPSITVNYTQAGAGECKTRITSEAANPQADVMFGGLVYADTLSMKDNFANYVSVNDGNLPTEFKNATGILTYHDYQIPCLWVNDNLEKEAGVTIKSYADLLNPALKGKIASADPTSSSSAWNQLQCILTDFGGWNNDATWTYIDSLMANLVITDGSSAVYKGVYNGEYAVGLTYEPACVQMLSEGAQGVHIVYPTEGVTSIAFGSAIIKNCKNLDNAKLFMDFLTSDECQQIYNECGARQANSNLKIDNQWLPDLSTFNYKVADTKALAENQSAIQEHWKTLWNTHA